MKIKAGAIISGVVEALADRIHGLVVDGGANVALVVFVELVAPAHHYTKSERLAQVARTILSRIPEGEDPDLAEPRRQVAIWLAHAEELAAAGGCSDTVDAIARLLERAGVAGDTLRRTIAEGWRRKGGSLRDAEDLWQRILIDAANRDPARTLARRLVSEDPRAPRPPSPDDKPVWPHGDVVLLHAHAGSGQWRKTIRGKDVYFGPLHDPDGALQRWKEWAAIAGCKPNGCPLWPAHIHAATGVRLTSFANGQWGKKIRGEYFYFGKWAVPDPGDAAAIAAVDDFRRRIHAIAARTDRPAAGAECAAERAAPSKNTKENHGSAIEFASPED